MQVRMKASLSVVKEESANGWHVWSIKYCSVGPLCIVETVQKIGTCGVVEDLLVLSHTS